MNTLEWLRYYGRHEIVFDAVWGRLDERDREVLLKAFIAAQRDAIMVGESRHADA